MYRYRKAVAIDPKLWQQRKDAEEETVQHPCDFAEPAACMCKGACSCHWLNESWLMIGAGDRERMRAQLRSELVAYVDEVMAAALQEGRSAEAVREAVRAVAASILERYAWSPEVVDVMVELVVELGDKAASIAGAGKAN